MGFRFSYHSLAAMFACVIVGFLVVAPSAKGISGLSACLPTDENLVAYWKFDEGGESFTAIDSTTYLNNGNVSGAVWNISAPSLDFNNGYSMFFDGSNDVVTVTDTTGIALNTNASFSVTAWVKPTSFSGYQTIVHKIDDTGSARAGYLFTLNNGTPEVWLINDYANNVYTVVPATVSLSTGTWTHIGFTYNGSGNASGVRIYVSGSDVTGVSTQNTLAGASIGNTQSFEIGYRSIAGAQAFAGYLDDVRVYSASLGSGDVADLAAGQCTFDIASSSASSASSSSSSSVSDTDGDGIPDVFTCTTTMVNVCTPMPDVCVPMPPICVPGPIEDDPVCTPAPSSCTPQPPVCMPVPSTTCSGPDNCPFVANANQADANENGTGDACEAATSSSSSASSVDDDPTNGSYRGSRTNVLRSIIAMFGGQPTGVPPPAYGGPGQETFTASESELVCRIYNAMTDDAGNDVYIWAATQLSLRMPHSVQAIVDALRDGGLCPEPVAKAVKVPKAVTIRLDANGFPVSSNDTWNKCIAGTATLEDIRNNSDRDEDGFGYSCSRYHTQDMWNHPDHPGMLFTWKRGSKSVSLPAGYALKQDTALTQK